MKYENEITVSVNISKKELISFLEKNSYKKIENYIMADIYYIKNETDLSSNILDIFKDYILIRSIKNNNYLVCKHKEYTSNGDIINQGKQNLQISNINDARSFLNTIGYKELISVIDDMTIYEKNGLYLCIQYVNDKYLYIEVEVNEKYDTIEKVIKEFDKANIDYDRSNYYVNKAKIIFEENY